MYVLDPRLQDGKKIPKWEPKSRRGQYVGASTLHASSVGVIRNLRTENLSPQFHVVYDNYFETVHAKETETPESWDNLVTWSSERLDIDTDDPENIPELPDEWVNDEVLETLRHQIMERRDARQVVPVVQGEKNLPEPQPMPQAMLVTLQITQSGVNNQATPQI